MPNLKEIKNRLSSVTSTQQITGAMKMVSAAKLKKAQDAIIQLRPYARKLNEILIDINDFLNSKINNEFTRKRPIKKVLLIVITSNRGLCGGFNANVIRKVFAESAENYNSQLRQGNVHLYIIGKKGGDLLKRRNFHIIKTRNDIFNTLNFENASLIASDIMQLFIEGKYDRIDLIYNEFKNAAVQILTTEQFLPMKIVVPDKKEKEMLMKYETYADFIFESSKEYIVDKLIPRLLKIQFYKALLDSHASEYGARMTSMHKATDNAGELIKELTLEYNKARQAAITKEILEITSGAEALRSS